MRTEGTDWKIIGCVACLALAHFSCIKATPESGAGGGMPAAARAPHAIVVPPTDSPTRLATTSGVAPGTGAAGSTTRSSQTPGSIDLESARQALTRLAMASDDLRLKSTLDDLGDEPVTQPLGVHFGRWFVDFGELSWNDEVPVLDPGGTYVAFRYVYDGHFIRDETGQWVARLESQGATGARGGAITVRDWRMSHNLVGLRLNLRKLDAGVWRRSSGGTRYAN